MHVPLPARPLAVVSGAANGIGLELARECAEHGFDLLLAADRSLQRALSELEPLGVDVETVELDLSTRAGADELLSHIRGREVQALLVVDCNISGSLLLAYALGNRMRTWGCGRILLTGPVSAGKGTAAYPEFLCRALREELKGSGVTVTRLVAVTDGSDGGLDPAAVARVGYSAMMDGDENVTARVPRGLAAGASGIAQAGLLI